MLNTVILMGRLSDKPELRKTQNGISLTSFTLAVDGRSKDDTNWIDCTAWRQTAEFITTYFGKGQLIAITGHLESETYTNKAGNRAKAIRVTVDSASFSGSKDKPDKPAEQGAEQSAAGTDDFEEVGTDDDLPF